MELILKGLENDNKNNITSDGIEEINLIIYIASLTEDVIAFNEFEAISKVVYYALTNAFKHRNEVYIHLLEENAKKQCFNLVIDKVEDPYRVHVRNKFFFEAVLLNSVKYFDILHITKRKDDKFVDFLRVVVTYITKCISIEKPISGHLLRTLLLILSKYNILTNSLSLDILICMNKIALSPIPGFKHFVHNISKITICALPKQEQSVFLTVDVLPIIGLDTCTVVKLFSKNYIKNNISKIVHRVLTLFLNNIENKDGGFLYETILFYSFNEWQSEVWPLFLDSLKQVEYESEFFQSLVKYWIPSNVSKYRSDFYEYLRNENIDNKIKAYVLLESRRRGFITQLTFDNDILQIFCCVDTASLCLKIVSTYHKKSLCPSSYDISIVLSFLHSNLNTALQDGDIKSLQMFFSQMLIHAHIDLKRSDKNLPIYTKFMNDTYSYCYGCLKTLYFEVASQVILILWDISTGSYRSLNLRYKVEQRDFYEEGENLLYRKLQTRNLWKFHSDELYVELKKCFLKNKGIGINLTKLLVKSLNRINLVDAKMFYNILDSENSVTLRNTERIKNYSEIYVKSGPAKEISDFLTEIAMSLSNNLCRIKENCFDEDILYRSIMYLDILLVASRNEFKIEKLHHVLEEALDVVSYMLENKHFGNFSYKTMKVLEAFINNIMHCISLNLDVFWTKIDKHQVILHLIKIIQKSNMKRPVSLSIEVLKHFGSKMEETDSGKAQKIRFIDSVIKSLYKTPTEQELRIRRSPESRLVIHAMCCSIKSQDKPLLKWVLNSLLDVLTDRRSTDSTLSSALHSIEILVSDSALHTNTLPFIFDIIVNTVELFKRTSWIVRNADLQLSKALIERFYGVCVNGNNRPKNVEDLFLLFPRLSVYFFQVLSSENLDDRSILVFQFFFESQAREHVLVKEIAKLSRNCFLALFADIIKKYPNNYGKLAVSSYSSLCIAKEIPRVIRDVTEFVKSNFEGMPRNVFANFVFLLQELYEKYTSSFECLTNKKNIRFIRLAIHDLLKFLQNFDGPLFDFLLLKIKPVSLVLKEVEFLNNENDYNFEKRLWLHNNITFLLVNAKPKDTSNILHAVLSAQLLSSIQVKILSILVAKIENDVFSKEEICDILEVLFDKSVLIDDSNNYLLNCYFKTILVFCEKVNCIRGSGIPLHYKHTNNLYKTMIFVLYFSDHNFFSNVERDDFYRLVQAKYFHSLRISEELDNDIASTLHYFQKGASKHFRCCIFKLGFYFALFSSTYHEAYNFISLTTGKSYCSILTALKDFLSVTTLTQHLEEEKLVAKFLFDVNKFTNSMPETDEDCEGYYSVESDYLVPKLFLKRMLKCIDNT